LPLFHLRKSLTVKGKTGFSSHMGLIFDGLC